MRKLITPLAKSLSAVLARSPVVNNVVRVASIHGVPELSPVSLVSFHATITRQLKENNDPFADVTVMFKGKLAVISATSRRPFVTQPQRGYAATTARRRQDKLTEGGVTMKLYIYEHCPYCAKARMIFGLKGVPVILVTLPNDDEATPHRMIGKKMVPILERNDGTFMPESMDIVHYVDERYGGAPIVLPSPREDAFEAWLRDINAIVFKLAMPRWAQAPFEEFRTPGAIDYFTHKKEPIIGSFEENLAESARLIVKVNELLNGLAPLVKAPYAVHGQLTEDDFHLFAILRSLSVVEGLDYPKEVETYRHMMASETCVPLHDVVVPRLQYSAPKP